MTRSLSLRLSLVSSLSISALVAATIGCASVPVPQERLTTTEGSVRAATELGAADEPRASLHLKFAQEQLDAAKALIAAGDNARADIVLQKAFADAELALSMTRETAAIAQAKLIEAEVKALRPAT